MNEQDSFYNSMNMCMTTIPSLSNFNVSNESSRIDAFEDPSSNTKSESVFIPSKNGGLKTDGGKCRLDLIEPEFKRAMADILTFGMQKYGAFNWRSLGKRRIIASLERHLQDYREGIVMDTDAPHGHNLAAVAVNAMFALMIDLHIDDKEWREEKDEI